MSSLCALNLNTLSLIRADTKYKTAPMTITRLSAAKTILPAYIICKTKKNKKKTPAIALQILKCAGLLCFVGKENTSSAFGVFWVKIGSGLEAPMPYRRAAKGDADHVIQQVSYRFKKSDSFESK